MVNTIERKSKKLKFMDRVLISRKHDIREKYFQRKYYEKVELVAKNHASIK